MKEEKKHYAAPQLTVVEFATERGFAASGETTLSTDWQYVNIPRASVGDDRTDGGSIW